jgi:hypothetical protein
MSKMLCPIIYFDAMIDRYPILMGYTANQKQQGKLYGRAICRHHLPAMIPTCHRNPW